jgi:hypothetical protein
MDASCQHCDYEIKLNARPDSYSLGRSIFLKAHRRPDFPSLLPFLLCCFAMVALVMMYPGRANAEPFDSVYYHRLQGSFWAQLADDTGAAPTPRELAIASIQDNFKAIHALGFNTVTIGLPDSDNWVSQHGGGFSYDPKNPAAARPQLAVAQEIVLRIADANHLKVIFAIGFSEYRRSSDGRGAWAGLADEYDSITNPKGAFDYIHCLIDPTGYYGVLSTTRLSTVGLEDGLVRSHVGDERVVGWILSGEWNVNVVNAAAKTHPHEHIFKKYWNFFYGLVHYRGANTAFAATYLIGQPAGGNAQIANIKAFKQWFAPASGIREPDRIGVEFYGNTGYELSSIYKDLDSMVDAMEMADPGKYPHDYAIPASRVFLGEGSTNQTAMPAINQYFQDVFQLLADRELAGIQLWVTDTLGDATDAAGKPTLSPATPAYDLFTTTFSRTGVRTYASLPPGISWHGSPANGASFADPASYPTSSEIQPAAYGHWSYTGLTNNGHWVQQAIANHAGNLNLRFFANPNPVQGSGAAGSATLYWDASKMQAVKTVEVHEGTASGPIIARGGATGNAHASIATSNAPDFVLVDTTTGAHKHLGTVTIQMQ